VTERDFGHERRSRLYGESNGRRSICDKRSSVKAYIFVYFPTIWMLLCTILLLSRLLIPADFWDLFKRVNRDEFWRSPTRASIT
jgi:hypothetical protein